MVLIYLLAGRLRADDFFISPMTTEMRVADALELIAKSDVAAEIAIEAVMLNGLPNAAKLLIVLLYERAEKILLLPPRISGREVELFGQSYVPFEVRQNKLV